MAKNFFKVIGERTDDAKQAHNLRHVLKERKGYIEKQISSLEGDLDDLKAGELDAYECFVGVERKNTSGMATALSAILKVRADKVEVQENLTELKAVYNTLFVEDGEKVSASFDVEDED